VLGWIGAAIAGRWVRSFLYGMTDGDPISYVGAGGLDLLASVIAIVVPARRAAAIEPMEELRTE
jgi:ABC-type antimicrobial peptide transport system permease subunit